MVKIMIFLGLLTTYSSVAYTLNSPSKAQVPQTGAMQTNSLPNGADGNQTFGKAWPTPRFELYSATSSESACITDKLTGLMWTKDAYPKKAAQSFVAGLEYIGEFNKRKVCGYDDWRFPNKRELLSLVNYGYRGTASNALQISWLETSGFTGVQQKYWSSTTSASARGNVWLLDMSDGSIKSVSSGSGAARAAVWPVRGGK